MRVFVVLVVALAALACGGGDAAAPTRPLPTWDGHQADLFDDAIDPRAVGLNLDDTRTPQSDAAVRERTQTGDAVLRVRIETVTAKRDGDNVEYQLGMRTIEKLAGGDHAPPDEFTLKFDKTSPSAGIIHSLDARLGGKMFVAFLREFKGRDNEPRFHSHLATDSKDVIAAVKDAIALSEFK